MWCSAACTIRILLVQIDHRRLNIRMAQHGLDLSNRGPMVERQRSRRMAERMRRDRPEALRLRVEEPCRQDDPRGRRAPEKNEYRL